MGRHSRADDDEQVVVTVASLVPARTGPGRHARPDDEQPQMIHLIAEQDTDRLPAPEAAERHDALKPPEAKPEPKPEPERGEPERGESQATDLVLAEPASSKVVARVQRGDQSAAADLALLREHSDLRARVIAAIVAPFVIYTAVMYLIGAQNVYFIWVWIPLVTAGIVAGGLLDAAHRRHSTGG